MKKSMWKKLMSTILALVMVLGLSGTLGFQHVDATENSGFTFLPDKTEVKRGDIVTYSIDLAKNAKIAGITAQFTFDPDVLEAVGDGVDAKGYVKNAVKKGNVSEGTFGDFYVNTDGRIGIVAILNDNDKDKLADGNVAKISFKVKDTAKGDIGLKVKNLEFCDVNSEDIPTSEISVTKDNDAQIKICITKISTFLILCDLAVCLATLYVSFSLVFALMRYLQGKVFLIRFYSPTTLSSSRAEFRLPSRLACA